MFRTTSKRFVRETFEICVSESANQLDRGQAALQGFTESLQSLMVRRNVDQ